MPVKSSPKPDFEWFVRTTCDISPAAPFIRRQGDQQRNMARRLLSPVPGRSLPAAIFGFEKHVPDLDIERLGDSKRRVHAG